MFLRVAPAIFVGAKAAHALPAGSLAVVRPPRAAGNSAAGRAAERQGARRPVPPFDHDVSLFKAQVSVYPAAPATLSLAWNTFSALKAFGASGVP